MSYQKYTFKKGRDKEIPLHKYIIPDRLKIVLVAAMHFRALLSVDLPLRSRNEHSFYYLYFYTIDILFLYIIDKSILTILL